MAFIQRIQSPGDDRCRDHDEGGCCVIDCITTEPVTHHETGAVIHPAGAIVWHSHMAAGVDPLHRLNRDHASEDHRGPNPVPVEWAPWCDPCKAHPAARAISADSGS